MDEVFELTYGLPVGRRVYWNTVNGQRHEGRLKEWDNGTAIVVMNDGTEKAVRCD